jgi:hypothetical protein
MLPNEINERNKKIMADMLKARENNTTMVKEAEKINFLNPDDLKRVGVTSAKISLVSKPIADQLNENPNTSLIPAVKDNKIVMSPVPTNKGARISNIAEPPVNTITMNKNQSNYNPNPLNINSNTFNSNVNYNQNNLGSRTSNSNLPQNPYLKNTYQQPNINNQQVNQNIQQQPILNQQRNQNIQPQQPIINQNYSNPLGEIKKKGTSSRELGVDFPNKRRSNQSIPSSDYSISNEQNHTYSNVNKGDNFARPVNTSNKRISDFSMMKEDVRINPVNIKDSVKKFTELRDQRDRTPPVKRFGEGDNFPYSRSSQQNQPRIIEETIYVPEKSFDSTKKLIKYFVLGMAGAVIFYGFYYCAKYADFSKWFESFSKSTATGDGISKKANEEVNLAGYAQNLYNNGKKTVTDEIGGIEKNIGEKVGEMGDNVKGHLGNIYDSFSNYLSSISKLGAFILNLIINPREAIMNLLVKGATFLFREIIFQKLLYIGGTSLLLFIARRLYKLYQTKRESKQIFNQIKKRLKEINNMNMRGDDKWDDGLTEEDIIHEYSGIYKINEEDFRKRIFPELKKLRREDGEIKEYEAYIYGRNKLAWQYGG